MTLTTPVLACPIEWASVCNAAAGVLREWATPVYSSVYRADDGKWWPIRGRTLPGHPHCTARQEAR